MADSDREVLWEAEFNPKVRTYWLLSGVFILFATVVGIALIPIWLLIGNYFTGRYLSHMRCTLTPRTLEVAKGMFVRVEKTVPLDKITDVGVVHGPLMRYMGLQALSVETAGQSSAGALVKLIGIVDNEDFRSAILAQRDRVIEATTGGDAVNTLPAPSSSSDAVLVEIRDVLTRIESGLANRP